MKKIIVSCLLAVLFLSTSHAQYSNERTGYDGDYFSLEGALQLFQESSSLRDFERKINSERNWVNNLDLNYDGQIDYIRVEHRQQGIFHAIVLQALVDRYVAQDVAVIEIEVLRRGEAILQIVGDEDLYGQEVYVEPVDRYANNRRGYHPDYGSFVNVYYWRPIRHILDRQYRTYVSPYRWRYYPTWWNSWRPYSWNVFRPRIVVYHNYFHVVPRHRVIRVHNFYRPYRSYCPTVVQRTNRVRVKQGRQPIYRSTTPNIGQNNSQANQRNRVTQNSRRSSGSSIDPGQSRNNSRTSRDRTSNNREHDNIKTRTPQSNPNSRNSADRSNRDRTYSSGERSSRSRDSRTTYERKRSPSPKVNRPSGSSRSRAGSSSRSSDSRKYTPSREYKSSPRPKARSSSPARSRSSARSSTPSRKPTVKSRSSSSSSKSRSTVKRGSSSKKSSTSRSSVSRKRSGN